MTFVVGIRLNLVFDTDDAAAAREAAHLFGAAVSDGWDEPTNTLALVDDGKLQVRRVVYVGHETGYRLASSSVPAAEQATNEVPAP